jgi:hypothetical protein
MSAKSLVIVYWAIHESDTDPQARDDSAQQPDNSESSPFYRGIPAGEVVRAIQALGITGIAVLENPV